MTFEKKRDALLKALRAKLDEKALAHVAIEKHARSNVSSWGGDFDILNVTFRVGPITTDIDFSLEGDWAGWGYEDDATLRDALDTLGLALLVNYPKMHPEKKT